VNLEKQIPNYNIYHCFMEFNNVFNCWVSFSPLNGNSHDEMMLFYDENHFIIGYDFFDPEWSNEIQAEEIFKRLILLYGFDSNDENLLIVRGPKTIHLPSKNHQFVELKPGSIFVYNKKEIEVEYTE